MDQKLVVIGRIVGLHGVRGWVKVFSYTDPRENILDYRPWHLRGDHGSQLIDRLQGHKQGKGLIAQLGGIETRDAAAELVKCEILVDRDLFSITGQDEYYWDDLVGLEVATIGGQVLGKVDSLMETGANDVLVVEGDRRRLIPFLIGGVVRDVDRGSARITVDWDPEF